MSRIAMCSDSTKSRVGYLEYRGLPGNYMDDISLMGFVVSHYEEAVRLLVAKGCQLKKVGGGGIFLLIHPQSFTLFKRP